MHISRAEGLSYALLEVIYAGMPVICSDISENGFASKFPTVSMVKNENVDDISKAMKKQLANPIPNINDVELSRKMIVDEYSVSCWVENILHHYEAD